MNAWRSTRSTRSTRSDPARPAAEVTSTGMDTFAGPLADRLSAGFEVDERRAPRRLTAVLAFGVLAVSGAVGSYFAVLNGVGALLAERSPGAERRPLVAGPQGELETASTAGMGRGRAHRTRPPAGPTRPPARLLVVPATTTHKPPPMVAPGAERSNPPTVTPGGSTIADCADCETPPVPTPTSPSATSPSESPSATSPAAPSATSPSAPSATPPSESPSATPSESPSPALSAADSLSRSSPSPSATLSPGPSGRHHRHQTAHG